MKHDKKHYFLRSLITGIGIFIGMMLLLTSLIQTREGVLLQTRNIKSLQAISSMTEYVKYSIETRLLLLKGYEVYLMTNPDLTEDETINYLKSLIGSDALINNVGIIKDTTIIFNYPKEQNQKAIGVDVAKIPEQRDALLKVKNSLEPVFFGPVDLVQGGSGYIARMPILVDEKYWGQISIVLKADMVNNLFMEYAAAKNLEIAIFQNSVSRDHLVLGSYSILDKTPVLNTISIMNTNYIIAALNSEPVSSAEYSSLAYLFAFILSLFLAYLIFFSLMKSAETKVQASIDSLTKVHNRSYLDFFLKNLFQKAKQNGTLIGIIEMDIDHFKSINDTYGHLAGDAALQLVSSKLLSICRKTETVFRMGGDEFLIIFHDLSAKEPFETIVTRVIDNLPDQMHYHDQSIPIGISMGHALFPEDGEDFDTLFKHADQQMYKHKKHKHA
jgi:diguanylate cyclase